MDYSKPLVLTLCLIVIMFVMISCIFRNEYNLKSQKPMNDDVHVDDSIKRLKHENIMRKKNYKVTKEHVCLLYVGQMRENTVLHTNNHIDWLTRQFNLDDYIVHVYFVTDEIDLNALFENTYFGSKVKNIIMDYNDTKKLYIYDKTYLSNTLVNDIIYKLSNDYKIRLQSKIHENMLNSYKDVYTLENDIPNILYISKSTNHLQFLKLQLGLMMKKAFEKKHKIKYNVTFKIRPDITFVNPIVLDRTHTKFYSSHDFLFGSFTADLFDALYDFVDEYGKIDLTPLFGHNNYDPNDRVKGVPRILNQKRWYKAPEIQFMAYLCKITKSKSLDKATINLFKDMGTQFTDLSRDLL